MRAARKKLARTIDTGIETDPRWKPDLSHIAACGSGDKPRGVAVMVACRQSRRVVSGTAALACGTILSLCSPAIVPDDTPELAQRNPAAPEQTANVSKRKYRACA